MSYFFMSQTESKLIWIISKLSLMETNMASVQEIIAAARAEQDIIKAAVDQTNALVTEVKQLLAANDIAGAQELLDEIQANSAALVAAAAENAGLTAAVDAVNGDPQPAPEPIA
jgi:hypothetical protein